MSLARVSFVGSLVVGFALTLALGGCTATASSQESTDESSSAETAICTVCSGIGYEGEEIDIEDSDNIDADDPASPDNWPSDDAIDGIDDNPSDPSTTPRTTTTPVFTPQGPTLTPLTPSASASGVGVSSAGGLKLMDENVFVGEIKVQIPTIKGDRCHAGGVPVHITVTDTKGNVYKLKPTANGWVTIDGRPGPSNNVWKRILGNSRVQAALSKFAKAAGFCTAAFMLVGYDNYVSAGETSGYTILDKIKTMRTMQDICSPDANGVIQPVLAQSGIIPGGAGSGRDLHWEVIWSSTAGWIYTSFYYEPDCSTLESIFGCNTVKKVWLVRPDQQMQVPNGCLQR